MKKIQYLILLTCLAFDLAAQAQVTLVQDINAQPFVNAGLYKDFYSAFGKTFFTKSQSEIWVTDGTENGTQLLFNSLKQDSVDNDRQWTFFNGYYYFEAMSLQDIFGEGYYPYNSIFRTDGTKEGTTLFYLDEYGFRNPYNEISSINGYLYFSYRDEFNQSLMRRTTGVRQETSTMNSEGINGDIYNIFGADNSVYFTISSGGKVVSLSKLDMNDPKGYVEVKSLNHAKFEYAVMNNTLYFVAGNASLTNAEELWKIDPITNFPVIVKKINPGNNSYVAELTVAGNTLFFKASTPSKKMELWKTNGTNEGTVIVKDINPNGSGNPSYLISVGNMIYFSATDSLGTEVWKSDGTAAGTISLKDINKGFNNSNPLEFTYDGNQYIYFTANSGGKNRELWKTNGLPNGTSKVKEIAPRYESSSPSNLTIQEGTLIFSATNSQGNNVWKSDGTLAGTSPILQFEINTYSSDPSSIKIIDSVMYFSAKSKFGNEIYKSDGSSIGTLLVKDIYPGPQSSNPKEFTRLNGTVYFIANNDEGLGLFATDGTDLGTRNVKSAFVKMSYLTVFKGLLYFIADDGIFGEEIWMSDGTASGTHLLSDIEPGMLGSSPGKPVVFNNKLYFTAFTSSTGVDLYKIDGSQGGIDLVHDLYPGSETSKVAGELLKTDKYLFFAAKDTSYHYYNWTWYTLWKSDGTNAGSSIVLDDLKLWDDESLEMSIIGENVYFTGSKNESFSNPWVSDGTVSGTRKLTDVTLYDAHDGVRVSGNPHHYFANDSTLFFYTKRNVWNYTNPDRNKYLNSCKIYGGPAKDIGRVGLQTYSEVVFGQDVFITVNNDVKGYEIFKYENATKQFKLYQDLNEGPDSSIPLLYNFNNDVYLTGDDGTHGRELFRLNLSPQIPLQFSENERSGANENVEIVGQLTAFPNPVIDKVTIQAASKILEVKIFSVEGIEAMDFFHTNEQIFTVDLSGLGQGIYIAKILFADQSVHHVKISKR